MLQTQSQGLQRHYETGRDCSQSSILRFLDIPALLQSDYCDSNSKTLSNSPNFAEVKCAKCRALTLTFCVQGQHPVHQTTASFREKEPKKLNIIRDFKKITFCSLTYLELLSCLMCERNLNSYFLYYNPIVSILFM